MGFEASGQESDVVDRTLAAFFGSESTMLCKTVFRPLGRVSHPGKCPVFIC